MLLVCLPDICSNGSFIDKDMKCITPQDEYSVHVSGDLITELVQCFLYVFLIFDHKVHL